MTLTGSKMESSNQLTRFCCCFATTSWVASSVGAPSRPSGAPHYSCRNPRSHPGHAPIVMVYLTRTYRTPRRRIGSDGCSLSSSPTTKEPGAEPRSWHKYRLQHFSPKAAFCFKPQLVAHLTAKALFLHFSTRAGFACWIFPLLHTWPGFC